MDKKLSSKCPFCSGSLAIASLRCEGCDTRIESKLPIPKYFRLGSGLQEFVLVFLRCRGNIREVEKELGISYPTVCKRLDLVNELLGNKLAEVGKSVGNGGSQDDEEQDPKATARRQQILEDLEAGKFDAAEAAQLLRSVTKGAEH